MRLRFNETKRYLDMFFVFFITGALLFARLIAGGRELFRESLWAEDGLFALCNIKASAFSCGFDSFSGYWSGLPRFLSFLVSRFPIEQWALVNNIMTLLFLSSSAAFTYSYIKGQIQGKALAYFLVFAPSLLSGLTHEVLMVGNSIFAILGYYILLIFLYSDYVNSPLGAKFIAFCSLSFLYTISNPLGFLLLLICLIDYFIYKSRSLNTLILTLVLFFGNVIEGIFVLINHTDRQQAAIDLEFLRILLIEFIKSFSLLLYSPDDFNYLSGDSSVNIVISVFLVVFFSLTLFLFFRNFVSASQGLLSKRKILIPFLLLLFTLFISVLTKGSAARFEVTTSLYALLFVVGILNQQSKKVSSAAFVLLYLFVGINGVINFGASDYRSTGPLWSQQIENSQRFCEGNPSGSFPMIFSPNWSASIQHPYKVLEPTTEKLDCSIFLSTK